ncbi:MAG: DUF937 domain-containing protein [Armatimonas sp.]
MSNVLEDLLSQLDPATVGQIANQLGVDEGTAQNGIQAALPLLIGGLARNTQTDDGAQALSTALENDHQGDVLSDLMGAVSGYQNGPGGAILGHIFGGQQQGIGAAVGQAMGTNSGNGAALLQMLAPIVLGYLGQRQQNQGLNAGDLAGLLGGQTQQMEQQGSGNLMGTLSQLLDGNHDGSPIDDIIGMAGRFLKR